MENSKYIKDYLERINTVLEYIDENLSSDLSLNKLANVAAFSPFHFHRIFHYIVGETVKDYVQKTRLATAAYKLLYNPEKSITEISLDCGFSNLTSFSRSFKSEYKISARNFIIKKKDYLVKQDIKKRMDSLPIPKELTVSYFNNIRMVDLDNYNVAYIRCTGLNESRNNPEIERAFQKLFIWARSNSLVSKETRVIGITMDNPEFMPLEKCRYDCCITVPEGVLPHGEIGVRKITSKGAYISYCFKNEEELVNFYDLILSIYGWWLPNNGYFPDNKPFLELFEVDLETCKVKLNFHIPVKPT